MGIKVTHKMIKEMCGNVSFKKGDAFFRANKVRIQKYSADACEAIVSGVEDFYVTIENSVSGEINAECSCPTLANFQKECQHVAAVLIAIHDHQCHTITQGTHADGETIINGFMTIFNDRSSRTSGYQPHFENRKVLDVSFICKPVSIGNGQYLLGMDIELEQTRLQNIRGFLQNVKQGKPHFISNEFSYDPMLHCFLSESNAVIYQLIKVVHDEEAFLHGLSDSIYTSGNHTLLIPPSSWDMLVSLLEKTPMVVLEYNGQNFDRFQIVQGSPPIQFALSENGENDHYQLTINGFEQMVVLNAYHSLLCNGMVFRLDGQDCQRLSDLKQMLASPGFDQVQIQKDKIQFFLNDIVPGLKKIGDVQLSETLTNEFMKTPLVAKLYLDRVNNRLLAGLEFQYENVVIQPLENRDIPAGPMIIRDVEKEEEILTMMEESGFSKTEGGYFLQNEALEYEFLYHVVPKLQQLVQLYATTAVRNRIAKENTFPKIRIKVKKERTNWLEFTFEMDGITDTQIREILQALEEKRKYYRLKDGMLLSLESKEMEEIHRFLHAIPPQEEDIEATLNLPIHQSLKFLDTVEDSSIFMVDESFRQFLDKILHPDRVDFEVPEQLDPILRNYQRLGFKWMKTLASYGFGGVLADEMGLGKTIQSIAFISSELPCIRKRRDAVLIVCPSSLMYNWLNEIMKFAPELHAIVIDGNQAQRKELQQDIHDIDVIITSYPLLRRDIKWYEKRMFHTVFFDEAQAFKNPVTQTAGAVKRIQAANRFGLTGTPLENSLEEIWSIYHVVFPQLFQQLEEYSHLTRKTIARRLRPFLLRRMKKDVLVELPEKVESLEPSELLPEQKRLYASYLAKLRHDTLKHLDQDTIQKNRIRILAGITRLRQICCHPGLFVNGYKGGSAKFDQLLQILEESRFSGRRVLIFSQFTKMLDLIGRKLARSGHSYFYLDGHTPVDKRVEICNQFNDGKRDIFLISLKAGGTGLNLTGADTVILYDLWWNPAVEKQATDRAHRIGQKKTVQVIKLIARGTIEEKMNELQDKKKNLISDIIDQNGEASAKLTEEDIRDILQI